MHPFLWFLAARFGVSAAAAWWCIALPDDRYEEVLAIKRPLHERRRTDNILFVSEVLITAACIYFATR